MKVFFTSACAMTGLTMALSLCACGNEKELTLVDKNGTGRSAAVSTDVGGTHLLLSDGSSPFIESNGVLDYQKALEVAHNYVDNGVRPLLPSSEEQTIDMMDASYECSDPFSQRSANVGLGLMRNVFISTVHGTERSIRTIDPAKAKGHDLFKEATNIARGFCVTGN